MGKPSRLRRNRLRMTLFNLAKSNQRNTVQQNTIKNLHIQVSSLKEEINRLNEKLRTLNVINISGNVNKPISSANMCTPNEPISDNISHPLKPFSVSTVPSIKQKPNHNVVEESNCNVSDVPTAEAFIKYLKEYNTVIREGIQDAVSLVPNLPSQPP